uniref:Uncharacterized protein n=1 Tax=Tanacetum cinerariifolium TaxID=118510 RepID=A0A6L2JAA2_TANCI|nr:hypothetical protein [Tanacetum cinerariifolium]
MGMRTRIGGEDYVVLPLSLTQEWGLDVHVVTLLSSLSKDGVPWAHDGLSFVCQRMVAWDLIQDRMEQYLQCIDYTIWEIIENVNALIVTKNVNGKETAIPSITIEEKAQRRAKLKPRSTLLMALSNEHQLKFNSYMDSKILMKALKNKFGGTMHTIVWRNKPEIETLSLDDLFNNLKAYESKNTGRKLDMTNNERIGFDKSMWSVSTVTREDTLQGSAGHPGIKTAGTGSLSEGLCQLRKLLQMP